MSQWAWAGPGHLLGEGVTGSWETGFGFDSGKQDSSPKWESGTQQILAACRTFGFCSGSFPPTRLTILVEYYGSVFFWDKAAEGLLCDKLLTATHQG